ncbi:hypothetical protein [Pajaroellobacter abortibovis]|uniref:Uncharacterized protein n=1 Tax=Pajaroellobacter abortibovis TaxID=1882918 RepID=A0A1L6MW94_9BACT|nr:hypothetical protein [Pajaroellobacter abortibovis]APR99823.1 hypothetical protein BCY86_03370 [Pajaroellobacter abortibovis]
MFAVQAWPRVRSLYLERTRITDQAFVFTYGWSSLTTLSFLNNLFLADKILSLELREVWLGLRYFFWGVLLWMCCFRRYRLRWSDKRLLSVEEGVWPKLEHVHLRREQRTQDVIIQAVKWWRDLHGVGVDDPKMGVDEE